jgi:hypothetical protein
LPRLSSPTFDVREIFGVSRFSTFSTVSARSRHRPRKKPSEGGFSIDPLIADQAAINALAHFPRIGVSLRFESGNEQL